MKKVLSMLLALVMVLTIAAFPAFAEESAVAIVGVTGTKTSDSASRGIANAYDGDSTTYFTSDQYGGKFSLVFELAETITLGTLKIEWGGIGSWDRNAPKGYDVYVSNDGTTWGDPILSYTGLHSKATAAETYPGYTYVYGGTDNQMRYDMLETNLNQKNVKYIKITITSANARTSMREISVTKVDEASLVPTSYTVKYQSEDPNFVAPEDKVVGDVYAGATVTETALEIAGFKPDAETKNLTLESDNNVIIFNYTRADSVDYTVKYVDEAGNALADAKTVTVYEGDEVTETAPNLFANGYFTADGTKTAIITSENNEIVFTYKKVIAAKGASFTGLNGTGSWTSGGKGFVNVVDGVVPAKSSNGTYTINNNGTAAPYAEIIFTFDEMYTFDKVTAYWSNNDTNVSIYVSNDKENWSEAVYEGTTPKAGTTASGVAFSELALAENATGKYVKLVINKKLYTTLYEFTFEGEAVNFAANPEYAGKSEGAQIRLPSGTVPAGIRFGATLQKAVFGDALTGDYNYDELVAANIKVGMFLLPTDLLGVYENLSDYVLAGGENVLDIAAEKVYAEDTETVTFTAVVTNIPEKDYDREVVAVPYICINGTYTFYEEMIRDYITVTEAVAADYEAGTIELTYAQIEMIEGILGRTLTAPDAE